MSGWVEGDGSPPATRLPAPTLLYNWWTSLHYTTLHISLAFTCCQVEIPQPWIQEPLDFLKKILDSTLSYSTNLRFNNPWIQRHSDSITQGIQNLHSTVIGFNDPLVQQSWIQQSLGSTILNKKNLKMNFVCAFSTPWPPSLLGQDNLRDHPVLCFSFFLFIETIWTH